MAQNIEAVKNPKLPYQFLVHYPEGYKENPNKKYPLLMFLHGRSISGTDLEKVKRYGVIYEILRGLKVDFIVVAPQCQNGWDNSKLIEVLDYAENTYQVDKNKVYLTGMSMGGYGAWYLAGAHPKRFAAVAPVCGGGKLNDAQNLKDLPHWVHHGVKDIPVPFSESDKMVKAIRAAGNKKVEFSVYKDWGHSELVVVFSKKELYDWFLKYDKAEKYIAPEAVFAVKDSKTETLEPKTEKNNSPEKSLNPIVSSVPLTKPKAEKTEPKVNDSEFIEFEETSKKTTETQKAGSTPKKAPLYPERPSLVQRQPEEKNKNSSKSDNKGNSKISKQIDKIRNWEIWEQLK